MQGQRDESRVAMEEALKQAEFRRLVAAVATTLASVDYHDMDAAIDRALGVTGAYVGADRSYLMEFNQARTTSTNTHEWCSEGIEPQKDWLVDVPLDAMPWFTSQLGGGPIALSSISQLPECATLERELLAVQGIRSILIVPLSGAGGPIGFVGFDAVRTTRVWMSHDIELLHVLATILSGMLERRRAKEALDNERRRMVATVEAIPDLVFSVSASGQITFAKETPSADLVVPAEEAIGRSMSELLPPDVAALLMDQVTEALRTREPKECQYDLVIRNTCSRFEARFVAHASNEVTAIVRNITAQHEARRTIEDHRRRLHSLAQQQVIAEQQLRQRVAAEVHDGVAQELAMARVLLERYLDEPSQQQSLRWAVEVLDSAVRHVDELVTEISPPLLRQFGLIAALRDVAERLAKRHGLNLQFNAEPVPKLDAADASTLFWAARELIVNVVKHACATRLTVSVSNGAEFIEVAVSDDGVGLPERSTSGFGLFNVRERARLHGGDLQIESLSSGTKARVFLPRLA